MICIRYFINDYHFLFFKNQNNRINVYFLYSTVLNRLSKVTPKNCYIKKKVLDMLFHILT